MLYCRIGIPVLYKLAASPSVATTYSSTVMMLLSLIFWHHAEAPSLWPHLGTRHGAGVRKKSYRKLLTSTLCCLDAIS